MGDIKPITIEIQLLGGVAAAQQISAIGAGLNRTLAEAVPSAQLVDIGNQTAQILKGIADTSTSIAQGVTERIEGFFARIATLAEQSTGAVAVEAGKRQKAVVTATEEVVKRESQMSEETRRAWLASLPTPQIIDVTNQVVQGMQRIQASAQAATTQVQAVFRASANLASDPAAFMAQEDGGLGQKLAYARTVAPLTLRAPIDEATKSVNALGIAIKSLPLISSVLGMAGLDLLIGRVHLLQGMLRGIGGIGAAGGVSMGGIGAGLGMAAGAAPIVYDIWGVLKGRSLALQAAESQEQANLKALDSLRKLVGAGFENGQLRGYNAELLRSEIERQTTFQKDFQSFGTANRADGANQISDTVRGLIGQYRQLLQASFATDDEESAKHDRSLADMQISILAAERANLDTHLEGVLRSRKTSFKDQTEALESWRQRATGIVEDQANEEKGFLEKREAQLNAQLARTPEIDVDARAKVLGQIRELAEQRAKITQEANQQEEALNTQHEERQSALAEAWEQKRDKERREKNSYKDAGISSSALAFEQAPAEEVGREERVAQLRAIYAKQMAEMNRQAKEAGDEAAKPGTSQQRQNELLREQITLSDHAYESFLKIVRLDQENTFAGRLAANLAALRDQWSNIAASAANLLTNTLSQGISTFSSQAAHAIVVTGNFRDMIKNVGVAIEESFISGAIQMVTQWILSHVIMGGVSAAWHATENALGIATVSAHLAGEAAKTGGAAAGAAARTGIVAGETAAQTGITVAGASTQASATGVAGIFRSIMELGPIAGPVVFATAVAGLVALVYGLTKGFATGGLVTGPGTGTSDSIPARLSNREYVNTAATVANTGVAFLDGLGRGIADLDALGPGIQVRGGRGMRGGSGTGSGSGGGGGGSDVHLHVAGIFDSEGAAHKAMQTPKGEAILLDFMRRNAGKLGLK